MRRQLIANAKTCPLSGLCAEGSWVDLVNALVRLVEVQLTIHVLERRLPSAIWQAKGREASRIQMVLCFLRDAAWPSPTPPTSTIENRKDLDARLHWALQQSAPAAIRVAKDMVAAGYTDLPRQKLTFEIRQAARRREGDRMLRLGAALDVIEGTESQQILG